MALLLFQLMGFDSPLGDESSKKFMDAVRTLSNLEFNPPKDPNKVIEALAEVKKKLDSTPAFSPEHEHMMHMLAKLCPEKKGKVEAVDIHYALQSLQAKAAEYKTSFSYSNTSLAQSFVGGVVKDLNKNAPQKNSYG